ncbi:unnamed protein product [Rotaria sordida]|uniref:Uncharacterized protein n=1 Tax=Rotaria sordida TaxID=392033 RepID=A0A814CK50_9BILA|nr:unnamed protein product [Rotaria sordida]CAF0941159.1 unnamed protein product [Rotaria sordida]
MGNSTATPATSLTRINTTTFPVPRTSASVINPNNSPTPEKSPTPPIPLNSSNDVVPVASPTARISAADRISITSPSSEISVTSPTLEIPLVSSSPSINDIPDKSSNLNLVISPDTSPIPPTSNTPIRSLTRPVIITPVNFTISPTEIRSDALIANDASANPNIPVASTTPVIYTNHFPNKVVPKRPASRISISSSTSTLEQPKSINLSSGDRSNKWNKLEQGKQKQLFHVPQHTDLFTSTWTDSNNDQTIASALPHIVALPSFALRTTAVCKPSQDDRILSERIQSTHSNISIFKFYLDQKETKPSIGNHTKATMFKMDTRLKQTPFPSPSLSFFTKNFNDGTPEIDTDSTIKPTFQSLGLQNDFEIERINQSPTKIHSDEKQQQRKILHSSSFSDLNSNSNNSFQFTTSVIIDQSNDFLMGNTSVQNNRQPLTSVLKDSSSQMIYNPYSTVKYNQILQGYQKPDLENYRSTVPFDVVPTTTKPSQKIINFMVFNISYRTICDDDTDNLQ